ncbi:TrkH family potassium uptake protein [Chakrabartyella piscis]|uniref:TrkH family potassium uptake protein n=1 Tax=Chakrabartyella piscis TaxID=2918914 RepID=UPI00295877AB|nr:potassium transporter TrkG [Chakrabartyella piscis]
MKEILQKYLRDFSPMKAILYGYCTMIVVGTILLYQPFALKTGATPNWMTAFFTATSATCVTGLVVVDTYTHWSGLGQLIILCLIQIGGIGFMTVCISAVSLTKKKIGFVSRSLMQNSISAPQLGGIVRMSHFVFWGALFVETIGAFLLAVEYVPKYGAVQGAWYSIFHSISAFCNAGFDLMGQEVVYSSMTASVGNVYINVILMLLIVIGGLGFFVWQDIIEAKLKFSQMHLHTKLVVFVSVVLILGGAIGIHITQFATPQYQEMSTGTRVLSSIFQSVTARTAGFNTLDLDQFTEAGLFCMMILMLIGGSAGSTAGGMKTTTFAVLCLSVITTFDHRKSIEVFGRRLEEGITRKASCIFMMYLFVMCIGAMAISQIEGISMLHASFECVSAVATVGLTTGITGNLSNASLIILAILMIFGRAGSLTMLLAFASKKAPAISKLPLEKIQIG